MGTGHRSARQRGVTLIELMVVLAVIGVLVSLAALAFRPSGYARTATGYAEKLMAELDTMRLRATSTNTWQRLEVFEDGVIAYQSSTTGMAEPTAADWNEMAQLPTPSGISIYAHVPETRDATGDPLPSAGDNLTAAGDPNFPDNTIDILPDGSLRLPATLYLQDEDNDLQLRLALYRASAVPYLIGSWQ